MRVLGARCSNKDYTFCILSGDADSPQLETKKHVAYPTNFTEAEILNWLHQEMQAILAGPSVDRVGIKRAETNVKRSNSLELRIQAEAVISLAAAQAGCGSIERKVCSTIAKDLGLKGKAKYLHTKFDTSAVPDFDDLTDKEQEAVLVAWSCLN